MLKKLNISKAHFIGHDRGVVVFEHLMIENEGLFLSFSRGAQVWDYYEEEWSKLAPNMCVGPPHRFFTSPWQIKLLFNIITFFGFPLAIRSEGFLKKCRNLKKGTQLYDRNTHLTYKANFTTKKSSSFYTNIHPSSTGSPLIVRFLGPRKNRTNGNPYY